MNGAQLMRGEPLGPPVPPRDIDRYPHSLLVDFRRCSAQTLRKYCAKYELDPQVASLPHAEVASLVAKHFQKDLHVKEETVLKSFAEYALSYSGGNTLEDIKFRNAKRLRKRTRRTALSDVSDDEGGVQSEGESEIVLYCICNRPSYGEMVACDSENCQAGEWFHVACVGLKEGQVPANWYCPECEKKVNNGETSRRRRTAAKKRLGEN